MAEKLVVVDLYHPHFRPFEKNVATVSLIQSCIRMDFGLYQVSSSAGDGEVSGRFSGRCTTTHFSLLFNFIGFNFLIY